MVSIRHSQQLKSYRRSLLDKRDPNKPKVIISTKATCCHLKGSKSIASAFERGIEKLGQKDKIDLVTAGCLGFCQMEPIVLVEPAGIIYPSVEPGSVEEILSKSVMEGKVLQDLVYQDPITKERFSYEKDIPFYARQKRLVLGNNGKIDPTSIDDYIAVDGYSALDEVLSKMSSDKVSEEVIQSGLRGRGGAGFPTGVKWWVTREEKGDKKYIICNADEGDPGAYMDRSILESTPHSVIEGMIIGAYAIGAAEGWVYIRNEYPLAIEHLTLAIEQARNFGLIGKDILGSGFDFDIKIAKGAGAFVCGEETALIASIEGKRGIPVQKPPFPAKEGLFGKPTNINNVETWATVPIILSRGADWYANIGTEKSKGTKIFSLVGKVVNTGLVEVAMGTTLEEVVFEIGGGAPNGKDVKAVQIGGPSGGCIPRELFHLPIDYESLTGAGAIMGSGGMIVMDEDTCMVDVAKYFTNFLQEESCGKCVTCREGTQRMHQILTRIAEGLGKEEDIATLEDLGRAVQTASMCGLGQTAPNPMLSTLRHYHDEYIAHIKEKRCPAKVCKALIEFSIIDEECTGCEICKKNCPQEAIVGEKKEPHSINTKDCIQCGICFELCKFGAIIKTSGGI